MMKEAKHIITDQEFDFVFNIVNNREGVDGKVTMQGYLNVLRSMKKDYDRYVGVRIA